ncbi:protein-disulfide reductase DsbD family protein [Sphingomonas ginkgonis]|uniref:protein-disulfide reductase DsbD family protein n=1 Tax=Sphingomonas ginkgonis TaxID=2315330 RepID=UPI0030B82D85
MLRFLIIALALLLGTPAAAQLGPLHIRASLIAEGPVRPGGEVELAIHMQPDAGWHGYWQNPGDAGQPMSVDWQLPAGATVGLLRYPVPTRLTVAGLMNYVFERDYAVLVRFKAPPNASGTLPLRAHATWLACTEQVCVPQQGELAVDVPVGDRPPVDRARFDGFRQALPRPLAAPAHVAVAGDKLRLAIALPASVPVGTPYVYPLSDGVVDYAAPQHFSRSGDTLVAELQRKGDARGRFEGVLSYGDSQGLTFSAVPGAVPEDGTPVGDEAVPSHALWWALLGALAGGIILNLMPCVFPILALKTLHIARSGAAEQAHARSDALAYTAGAVAGTGALGVALLAIRAAGSAAGWAFQLQDPRTILLLMLLAAAIALNLAGLFKLPVLGGEAKPGGSFATGALAAFVATPCAGPFLGSALGIALLLPTWSSVLVFAALGLGLALPFLLIGFVPRLRALLPKPGKWMLTLQRVLAFPMALTALACLWLLWRQAGQPALLIGLAALALLSAGLVALGRRQSGGAPLLAGAGFIAIVAAAGATLVLPSASTSTAVPLGTERWSEARVAELAATRKPAFVYFTADWCLSCKVNEAAAIDRAEVRDAFKAAGVNVLAGDWTNGDPAITRFLETQERAGVPLYLWYAPGKPAEVLPQILTPAMLIERARSR